MRQMKQEMLFGIRGFSEQSSLAGAGFSHTPSDAVRIRQMKQELCAKRSRELTPNETGTMRQVNQRKES
jgi:hypothetical protein